MFEGDSADMGDPGEKTPIGVSGNYYCSCGFFKPSQFQALATFGALNVAKVATFN